MVEHPPRFFCREFAEGFRIYDSTLTEPYDLEERRRILREQGWNGPYSNTSTFEFNAGPIHGGHLPEDEARWMAAGLNEGKLTVAEVQEAIDGP